MHYLTSLLVLASSAHAIVLPSPTGPFSVGVSTNTLTDEARMDPFAPEDAPHKRKVQVSAFVPLNTTIYPCVSRSTPYMTHLVAGDYNLLASTAGLPNTTFSSLTMELCDIPRGKSCFKSRNERPSVVKLPRPLLLFSPGFGQSRLLYSDLARSLASEGYIVVTVDHPYDATVVEFNDGSFIRGANISTDDDAVLENVIQVRATDISYVIDQLQNSSALRKSIENSGSRIDFNRIIMYGHSLGGAASAATMLSDTRILGGVNMDGRFFSPVTEQGVDRPFLNIGRPNHRGEDPTWDEFYGNMRAQIIEVAVANTTHSCFTDYPAILSTMNLTAASRQSLQEFIGTGDLAKVGSINKSLVIAFSNFVFNHTVPRLLQGTDDKIPEVELVRSSL